MRRAVHGMLLCAGTICAQEVPGPAQIGEFIKLLEAQPHEQPLRCIVTINKPSVDYAFRFESGYSFQVPLSRYSGPDQNHTWTALTEITPQARGATPVYLLSKPNLTRITNHLGGDGVYLLGEGSYSVRWVLVDELGRVCRRRWRIVADRRGRPVDMLPNTVSRLTLTGLTEAQPHTDPGPPVRLTVLLDAAHIQVRPLGAGSPVLNDAEQFLLFSGLQGLLERLPTSSVRLIVFNLEQQRELFRKENFTLNDLDLAAQAMKDFELGSVQLKVLERPKGYVDLLVRLLNGEVRSEAPSDVVVFLGAQERYFDKILPAALEEQRAKPHFFSVQFVPPPRWVFATPRADGAIQTFGVAKPVVAGDFDTISEIVKRLKGKAVQVWSADEFEKAIADIELTARERK